MKKLKELKKGDSFTDMLVFVKATTQATTKAGKPYVRATLSDGSMETTVNEWDCNLNSSQFQLDHVYSITGSVGEYNGNIQLNLTSSVLKENGNLSDFLRQSERNVDDMMIELKNVHINKIINPLYSYLLKKLVIDVKGYKIAPAASKMHHPWIGGLLEHSLGLCTIIDSMYESHYYRYFPNLNLDLVKTSLILHDWGKVLEYDATKPGFPTTEEGILSYHMGIVTRVIILSAEVFRKTSTTVTEDLAKITRDEKLLVHCIDAHHGIPEYGSRVRPALPEALFVHWLDNFDAQIMNMRESLQGPEGNLQGYSVKNWAHGTVYKMQSLEAEEVECPF